MARIVVIRHQNEPGDFSFYMMAELCARWADAGHEIRIVHGCEDLPDGDLAILHVDLTVVPDAYRKAVAHYPRVINGRAIDLRKRNVSRILLARGDPWPGKVMIKPDLNFAGIPEWRAANPNAPASAAPKHQGIYWIVRSLAEVPEEVWSNDRLVVERFLPEQDGDYYHVRVYTFFGDRGRNRICRSHNPIVKGPHIIDHMPGPKVPEALVAERERLGMDYGKIDYVIHEGVPVVFDANRTPSFRTGMRTRIFQVLAAGLGSVLPSLQMAE